MAFAISSCLHRTFSALNRSTSAPTDTVLSTVGLGGSRGATKTTTSWAPSVSATSAPAAACTPSTVMRVALTAGALSAETVNSYEPDRPAMRKDHSAVTRAVTGIDAEYCSAVGDALTRKPTAVGTLVPGSATTRPEIEAPGPSTSERSSASRSCTSNTVVANSPLSMPERDVACRMVNRYRPGGTRGISNVPLSPTAARADSVPKPPSRWNSLTARPAGGPAEGLTTEPDTRTPRTGTSWIWIPAAGEANADTDTACRSS